MIPIKDYPGPRRRMPYVTWGLIAVNVLIFLYQFSLGSAADVFVFAYGVVPRALVLGVPQTVGQSNLPFQTPNPVYLTLLSSMFLHGGWLHLGGNMLFLFIFGDNVEDRMGHLPYLAFYLFCGICASLAQVLVGPNSIIPSIGASGAIAGVLASYLLLFPWSQVRTVIFIFVFFTMVTIPAIVLIGLWFVLQLFNSVSSFVNVQQNAGGVAYAAHVGGFVVGLLITLLVKPMIQPPPPVSYPYFPRHPNSVNP